VLSQQRISCADRVPETLARLGLANEAQEVFWVITYDAEMKVRTIIEIARGTYAGVMVNLPALFSAILASGCDRFMVAHNHPSDNPRPTSADKKLTAAIMDQANALGLYFENHYIVTPSGKFTDFTVAGLMKPAPYHSDGRTAAAASHEEDDPCPD
jgi:DNA repair protein RadC